MCQNLMSSVSGGVSIHAQNKISDIVSEQFNSYDSFDAKTLSCSLAPLAHVSQSGNHFELLF